MKTLSAFLAIIMLALSATNFVNASYARGSVACPAPDRVVESVGELLRVIQNSNRPAM